jgi:plastocyanin domain-containing protein
MKIFRTITSTLAIATLVVACSKSETSSSGGKSAAASGDKIAISFTEKGFEPENITVPSGKPVTLEFTRKTDKTCAHAVVIPVGDQKIEKEMPLNEAVAVQVTFPKAGQLTYGCQMDMMFKGVITVQ